MQMHIRSCEMNFNLDLAGDLPVCKLFTEQLTDMIF